MRCLYSNFDNPTNRDRVGTWSVYLTISFKLFQLGAKFITNCSRFIRNQDDFIANSFEATPVECNFFRLIHHNSN